MTKFAWKKGKRREPEKEVKCEHCSIPMARPSSGLVVAATCCNCLDRARVARVQA